MSLGTVDYAYTNLLTHLRQGSGISHQTVFSALPHYLAQLTLPHPTQLTAFVISSSLWQPLSVHNIRSLTAVYRSAIHVKHRILQNDADVWFARSRKDMLAEWVSAVLKGVSRGNPQLRIAILGGLLIGHNDLVPDGLPGGLKERLEGQIVIACAEMLEVTSSTEDMWNEEFMVERTESNGPVFLYSAYSVLPFVATGKLLALDLSVMIRLIQGGIKDAFLSGEFLSHLSTSISRGKEEKISISPESSLASTLEAISKAAVYQDVASLAKLQSRCLSLLAGKTPKVAWRTFQSISEDLECVTSKVELDWNGSHLANTNTEKDIGDSEELTTNIWKVLKTLLFTHLMVSQSILSSIQYLRPPPLAYVSDYSSSTIAISVLRSLNHLSFVISQFGGVTSSGEGFKELKRVFYMALDILSTDPNPQTSNTFVKELILRVQESRLVLDHPSRQSQTAYLLTMVEQLMLTLNDTVIENNVVPFCHPYLTTTEHRETYESAHSAMLSIFSAHSQKMENNIVGAGTSIAERLIPFYVEILLKVCFKYITPFRSLDSGTQNSSENKLNVSQLRMAYSSLLRSASVGKDNALAWLCIDALFMHIHAVTSHSPDGDLMHLYLTLVSLVSCAPPLLLPRVLLQIQNAFRNLGERGKSELGKAIVEEITHKIGDREKEMVLSWWCRVAPKYF
ncbi:hypothetical protein K439DRAFT_1345385 [Ramaria rubella]|nr:hypothetical protein K439DRAFT_1345385 [Ramaria rubella]